MSSLPGSLELPGDEQQASDVPLANVNFAERWLSLAAGSALAAAGLSKRGPLALLAAASGGYLLYRGVTGRCAVYGATGSEPVPSRGVEIREQFTLIKSPEEAYAFWKDFERLPRFMQHLADVKVTAPGLSRWTARLPGGMELSWDAAIIDDQPGRKIAWQSLEGSSLDTWGRVRFDPAPAGRGTEIRVVMHYRPPAGLFGETAAWLARPLTAWQIREDLRRFKRLIETGEIPTTAGQPSGRVTPCAEQLNRYPSAVVMQSSPSITHDDAVVEASAASFPASDAPPWTPTKGT